MFLVFGGFQSSLFIYFNATNIFCYVCYATTRELEDYRFDYTTTNTLHSVISALLQHANNRTIGISDCTTSNRLHSAISDMLQQAKHWTIETSEYSISNRLNSAIANMLPQA
jgi:hypothetical protein